MALRNIRFEVRLFEDEEDRKESQKRILLLLEGLINVNRFYLQKHPETPPLYQSGVKYALPEQMVENPEVEVLRRKVGRDDEALGAIDALASRSGGEHFRDIPTLYEAGAGDCDNLASARVAELRENGVNAKSYLTWRKRPDGGTTYHNIVLWPDGGIEDPSRILGMGGPEYADERDEELRKLAERATKHRAAKRIADRLLGHGGGGGHGGGHGGHHGGGHGGRGRGGWGWGGPWLAPGYIIDDDDDDDYEIEILGRSPSGLVRLTRPNL